MSQFNELGNKNTSQYSRRTFLTHASQFAALGALAGWVPAYQISADAANPAMLPPDFPPNIKLYQQAFKNWSGAISVDNVWTCTPASVADVVTVVNWAYAHRYRVRPRGHMHNWSPLTMAQPTQSQPAVPVILLDTTQYLTKVKVNAAAQPPQVVAQTGVSMELLLKKLESAGLGVAACPAPGDLTLGGVLAIDGHGTGIPAKGEEKLPGQTYGSLSNLILSLTAVVFNAGSNQYQLKTFLRNDPDIGAFLTHTGRAFIVEVTLQVSKNQRLQCLSRTDISASELFAPSGSSGNTIASFLDSAGRVEAIWYPFTQFPWLKVWSVQPKQPAWSRAVTGPYNYPFSDNLPDFVTPLIQSIVNGDGGITPLFGQGQLAITQAGLLFDISLNLWGWSGNLLNYIKPSTLRVTANGYAIITSRSNVQQVIADFAAQYQKQIAKYVSRGQYPINGPVEIRVTGLDNPADVAAPGAVAPLLSALTPVPGHPEWDTAVWLDLLTLPTTPYADAFYAEFEQWLLGYYNSANSCIRPEWSKGWGYTAAGAWNNLSYIPTLYDGWATATDILNRYDPGHLYTSPLLEKLYPAV